MAALAEELEKALKTLAEAQRLNISGDGAVSEEVCKAQLTVEALRIAMQAAHHDTTAAEEGPGSSRGDARGTRIILLTATLLFCFGLVNTGKLKLYTVNSV